MTSVDADSGHLIAEAEETLDRVDQALARLVEGSYGICSVCGEPIDEDLLVAAPTIDTCATHAAGATP